MPAFDLGELQTLLATFQQTNQQLGNLIKVLSSPRSLVPQTLANLGIYANDAAAAAAGVPLTGLYINSSTYAVTVRHV